jgi:penicillin amidase
VSWVAGRTIRDVEGETSSRPAPASAGPSSAGSPVRRPRRSWRFARVAGLWVLGAALTLALVASGLVVWSVRRAFPTHAGELTVAGLSAPVTVYRDAHGIPQLYAKTAADLFRAQGYVHAQDRFWEMDFRRHVTAGRVAELFGPGQVATDAFLRTLGWRRVAEQELPLLTNETRGYLEAYAAGVNEWINATGGPDPSGAKSLEYTVLGLQNSTYRIEPWTPVDSLAWLKAMAWDLRGNMESEIARGVLFAHGLTRAQVDQLYPPYPYARNQTILPTGAVVAGSFDEDGVPAGPPGPGPEGTGQFDVAGPDVAQPEVAWSEVAPQLTALASAVESLPRLLGDGGSGIGSNSWVINGSHTTTGKPLLANDPHLSPSMPGIWYQMGLHCECEFNVAGFTFAGVPGVVIGHNARIAWGFTNLDPDVTDLYLERVDDGDLYLAGRAWLRMTTREETIKVAGADPVVIRVRSTRHGPILSDRSADMLTLAVNPAVNPSGVPLPRADPTPLVQDGLSELDPAAPGVPDPALASPYAVALRWTALDPGRTADALFAINRATDWTSFRAAAELFEVPAQNIVYADDDGNIGYQSPGRIPVRGKGDGTWPAPGWDRDYDWKGFIPFAQLPSVQNPAEGWIVTANQAVIGEQYQPLLTRDWSYGYRSQRIGDMVRERLTASKISPEDVRQMQFDNRNGFAPTLVPLLLGVTVDPSVAAARDLLQGWDFQQPASEPSAASAAAAFYNATWRHLLLRTFDELPEDRRPDGGDRWYEVLRPLLAQPSSPWWDDPSTSDKVETRDDLLVTAMTDAVAELRSRLGDDPAAWRWGALHTLLLQNATFGASGIAPIEWLFNRGPAGTSGGDAIVNATGWNARNGYEVDAVPAMRMIVDLSNLDASRWIQLTGNSGHAFHANYDDQFELWRTGQNLPMLWDRGSIESAAIHTLTLSP